MSGIKPAKGMHFTCDQRWEDMAPLGNDRFCHSCQKPVIDFTGWERDAMVAWFKERPLSCGQFRAEQIDPSLVAMKELDLGVRRGFFAALAALTFATAHAQQGTPSHAPTEQAPHSAVRATHATPPAKLEVDRCWVEKETRAVDKSSTRSAPRRKLYISKRFPFIHLRHRRTMGRIAMGCPSF